MGMEPQVGDGIAGPEMDADVIRSSRLFDAEFYWSQIEGKDGATRDAVLSHYLAKGEAAGLRPNPLFDPAYYAVQAGRTSSGGSLLAHYIREGWREGFRTHPLFDTAYYVAHNPEILAVGINPLLHFLVSGGAEGRRPHPLFHSWEYSHSVPGLFESRENPLCHYLRQGWREGRNPHILFDSAGYLVTNPDVANAGVNPLVHFVSRGLAEGRRPNGLFSVEAFRRSGADPDRLIDEAPIRDACRKERSSDEDYAALSTEIARSRGTGLAETKAAVGPDAGVRVIAFYLPQFHPIPENDRNWGEGFTEWVNVRRATPNFVGHDQPRRPGELGYYDLRDPGVLERQASLAQAYGVHGFCYYWYWFNGRKPLALPLERMLTTGSPEMPFCLCWANEDWSRKWAGGEEAILRHEYSEQDDYEHTAELARYMRDPRYIRVSGAPLLLVYRAGRLPDPPAYLRRWRRLFRAAGIGEVHFALVESAEFAWAGRDPGELGFDSAVEFPPHGGSGMLPPLPNMLNDAFKGAIFDYRETVLRYATAPLPSYPRWRTVMGAWDNTARYQDTPAIFMNATPGGYRAWLEAAIRDVAATRAPGERLVFVNAWNEWGEGTCLEPDARWGRGYLEATRDALADASGSSALSGDSAGRMQMEGSDKASRLEHRGVPYLDFLEMVNRALAPRAYFEIGTNTGASLERFSCDALCVAPTFLIERNVWTPRRRSLLFQMTSDDFFEDEDLRRYLPDGPDVAFLDGMHLFEYLLRDFASTERQCHSGSLILMHDCLPLSARMAERTYRVGGQEEGEYRFSWTGDVWKMLYALRTFRPDLRIRCIDCPPTGLVAVQGLDPSSTVLHKRYEEVVAEIGRMEFDTDRLAELWSLYPTLDSRSFEGDPRRLSVALKWR